MSKESLGLDLSVEELGRLEFVGVGVRHYCHDELACSTLCRLEEGIILAFRLVDGLFLGPDRIFGGVHDGAVVNSLLLWSRECRLVFHGLRLFVLDEADEVLFTFFVVVGDLIQNLRDVLPQVGGPVQVLFRESFFNVCLTRFLELKFIIL